jgi:hypothetical protein
MNVRIVCPLSFTAGIHYNGELQMNNYTVKLFILTNSLDGTINNIALDRIKYFVYREMDSTIFINHKEEEQCRLYLDANIKITTIPEEPIDQLVGIMLFNKLTAIVEDRLIIDEIEISSGLGDGIVYIHSQEENVDDLPIPEWWSTSDLAHCDAAFLDDDEYITLANMTIWRDLELQWPDEAEPEVGNTVVFADFKLLDETK